MNNNYGKNDILTKPNEVFSNNYFELWDEFNKVQGVGFESLTKLDTLELLAFTWLLANQTTNLLWSFKDITKLVTEEDYNKILSYYEKHDVTFGHKVV